MNGKLDCVELLLKVAREQGKPEQAEARRGECACSTPASVSRSLARRAPGHLAYLGAV